MHKKLRLLLKFDLIIITAALSTLLLMGGCATLPDNFERPESYAYTDTDDTYLGKARRDKLLAHPGQSGFLLLANGLDAFVARAVLANLAERSIDVQYFMFHSDLIGRLLVEQLLIAADRGVRVRLLVDDIALGGRDLDAAMLDSHPNMEVRIFNPFSRKTSRLSQFVTRYGSVTRRMHNKSFTVDNQMAILGGRNIGDEYFEADPDVTFGDLDVLVIGPVVKDVSASFDLYWNSEWAYPALALKGEPPTAEETRIARQELSEFVEKQTDSPYLQTLEESDLAKKIRRGEISYSWGNAEVIYDQPEKIVHDFSKRELHLVSKLSPYLQETREEMIVFSPYFVPGKEGTAKLIQLSERGVRVRILTNSLASTNHSIVHSGYAKYRKRLLRAGVELYEMNKKYSEEDQKDEKGEPGYSETVLHAKSFVLDREKVFIGSLNLDPRAIYHNTEIGVVLTSSEIANGMGDWFDQNIEQVAFRLELHTNKNGSEKILWHGMENGKERIYSVEPHTGFCLRFGIGCIGFLPIESQL